MEELLSDPRLNNPVFRTRARKKLISKFNKDPNEALTLVPKTTGNRFKQGITRSIKDRAVEIFQSEGTREAIQFIIDNTSSSISAMNRISALKTDLKKREIDVSEINNSVKRLENQEKAIEKLEINRENKLYNDVFVIHDNFSYDRVINRIAIYINKQKIEEDDQLQFLADIMIAFAARPSELYRLKFVGDKITGHLKSRRNEELLDYAGIYPISIAKEMLKKLPKDLNLSESRNYKKLGLYLAKFDMQPRSLRTIGAEYITRSYKPEERRKIRQLALRHKNLATSLISYQLPNNIISSKSS